MGVLANTVKLEKKKDVKDIWIGQKEPKLLLLTDDQSLFVENSKEFAKMLS
jgi:hypothetical protein